MSASFKEVQQFEREMVPTCPQMRNKVKKIEYQLRSTDATSALPPHNEGGDHTSKVCGYVRTMIIAASRATELKMRHQMTKD